MLAGGLTSDRSSGDHNGKKTRETYVAGQIREYTGLSPLASLSPEVAGLCSSVISLIAISEQTRTCRSESGLHFSNMATLINVESAELKGSQQQLF